MHLRSTMLIGFVVLSGALAFKTIDLSRNLTAGLKAATAERNEAEDINRALLDRIHALASQQLSVSGLDAVSGRMVDIGEVDTLVVYLFGADCPFSPLNVAYLNALHAAGGNVIGIAPGERRPAIAIFGRNEQTTFPLLVDPAGSVLDILPRGSVPLTVLFLGGRVASMWLGPLTDERRQLLATRLGVHAG